MLLSYVIYLKAKNAPIIKPGRAMISDMPITSDMKIAITPQISETIISIRIAGLVAATSPRCYECKYKSSFPSLLKRNKKGPKSKAI